MRLERRLLCGLLLLATALTPAAVRADFVDEYRSNIAANATEANNPVIRLLNGFGRVWVPGATWDTGMPTDLGAPVLDYNIQYVVGVTESRTDAAEVAAYVDDRRNQSYSAIEGLGPLAQLYYAGSGALTTIPDALPPDATTKIYTDGGTGAGLVSSQLGNVVSLVATLRGPFSSTTPPKSFFLYPRPFRQSLDVLVAPTLVPVISPTPATDSGFPSGHTNAGYLAALALAHAAPERFQELLTRASELGDNRIVAGMHSPLDVMGGRLQATALAAAILADPANAALAQAAREQAQAYFLAQTGATSLVALRELAHSAPASSDRFADAATNRLRWSQRLTYGFAPIGPTDLALSVPKGAEVLLETRLPYLDADQRREVLHTTGLPSGFPLLDDAEGWGRLDLFAAADGYAAFDADVSVFMDAARDGFHARDTWRNAISGSGGLVKQGTGALVLSGDNRYTGGTRVEAGTLEARSASALGRGNVLLAGGTLRVSTARALRVDDYTQRGAAELALETSGRRALEIAGTARLAGRLHVTLAAGFTPDGPCSFELVRFARRRGAFENVQFAGVPEGFRARIRYTHRGLRVTLSPIRPPASRTGRSTP